VIEGLVRSALTGLVGGRCYPNTFIQPDGSLPTWPAIRYTVISTDPTPDIEGTADTLLDDVRVQIDFVAKTYGGALTLSHQAIAAINAISPPALREPGGFQTYDAETKTHRVAHEFVFYQSSALTGSP
jgi:hypothetical protein